MKYHIWLQQYNNDQQVVAVMVVQACNGVKLSSVGDFDLSRATLVICVLKFVT